ncbi:ATP-binding cassette domain-containing protein [Pedobacter sp. NJ-S-72]
MNSGEIRIGNSNLNNISPKTWRSECGAVLQDSYIFSETIINNIVFDKHNIDHHRFFQALEIANIRDFVDSLPLRYETKIGHEGHGLSQGQKQRILIARAVYKLPKILFLDEATNSLDSLNENVILNNLDTFFKNRTVVIVAHKLSTIKNSDSIIVLDKGRITEIGNHAELMNKRGYYFDLVNTQQVK